MGGRQKDRKQDIRPVEPPNRIIGCWGAPRMLLLPCWSLICFLPLISDSHPDVISHCLPRHHPHIDKQMSPTFDWHPLLLNAKVWFTNQFYLFFLSCSCVSYVFVGGVTCLISTLGLSINIINPGCCFSSKFHCKRGSSFSYFSRFPHLWTYMQAVYYGAYRTLSIS